VADKFRVGQKVIMARARFRNHLVGTVATITKQQGPYFAGSGAMEFGYQLDVYDDGTRIYSEEWQLDPLYDGDQKSSWSESAWKPQTEPMRPVAETK